jgi:uncharacterized protein YebE (UPF0316 family)
MKELEKYNKKAVYCTLKDYDYLAKEHSYVEITQWINGEGFDINVYNQSERVISLSYGEFKLIKKLIKKL